MTDTSTPLAFLTTPQGQQLLSAAELHPGPIIKTINDLRKFASPEHVSAAMKQVELRKRAKGRFELAHRMLFTEQGLEQATSEVVAKRRAACFPTDVHVLDLCSGIGADTIALARRGPVTAVDLDPDAILCSNWNAEVHGVAHNVQFRSEDVCTTDLTCEAAFWDPSRRTAGKRARTGDEYLPPLSWIEELTQRISNVCVKVAPTIHRDELAQLDAREEYVSLNGELREVTLWFGDIGPKCAKSAVLLPHNVVLEERDAPRSVAAPHGAFLLEPDPAVLRAELVDVLAHQMGAWRLDEQIGYLSVDAWTGSPFARAWPIREAIPLHLNRIARRLRELDAKVTAIKQRGAPISVEQAAKELPKQGTVPIVLVMTLLLGRPMALICEEMVASG